MPTAITCPTGKQPKPQASWTCQNCKIDLELSCEPIPATCGNDVLDAGEECDGAVIADDIAICAPDQVEKAPIVCKSDCTIDRAASCEAVEPPTTCGNDVLDAGEECDGAAVADDIAICAPDQVKKDPIVCKSDCTIDRAASCEAVEPPTTCGNDVLDAGEECDGAAVADDIAICAPDQVKKDPIVCKSDCTIDRAASCEAVEPPTTCGNDVLDAGEECDGAAVADDIAICAPGQIEKGTIVCKSDCTIDRAASCEAIDVPTTCNNSTLDIGELCDTSLSAYTPLACIYKDGLTDITYKADKTKSLPDSGSVFYIGKSLNTCSAACELVTNSCVAVQVSDLNLDKISTYDASYVSRTLNSKSKNYGKSNYDMRSLGISTNLTTSFDGSSGIYSYAFKDWDNTVPENGTFNDKKYIQYLPLHHNGAAYNRYEYVSIYFSYRTQDETSPSQFSVTLYKASDNNMNASTTYEFVGVISNFTVAKTGQWNGSGELVIPMQFLKDKDIKYPAVRINSYGGKTGTLYVKDLVVTLFNLK